MNEAVRQLIKRVQKECTSTSPRSMIAQETIAKIRNLDRQGVHHHEYEELMDDLDDILHEIRDEKNHECGRIMAGQLMAICMPEADNIKLLDGIDHPLATHITKFLRNGEYYEIEHE